AGGQEPRPRHLAGSGSDRGSDPYGSQDYQQRRTTLAGPFLPCGHGEGPVSAPCCATHPPLVTVSPCRSVRRATWGHVALSASFPVGPDQAVAVGAPIVLRSGVSGKRGALFLLAIRVTLELRVLAVDLLLVTGGIERVTVLGRRGFLSGFLGGLLGRLLRCGL